MFGMSVDSTSFMGQTQGYDPQFSEAYEEDLQKKLDRLTWHMDPREEALALRMLAYLDKKEGEYADIEPLMQQIMGYTTDDSGEWRKMTDTEYRESLTETEQADFDLYRLMQGRQQLALEGKAPISVGTQQRKEQDFRTFQEEMLRRGSTIEGDSFETATATDTTGIQSLESKRKEWAYTEDNERQMQIQTGAGNLMGFGGYRQGVESGQISELGNYLSRDEALFGLMDANRQIWQQKGLTEFENDMWKFTTRYNDAQQRSQYAISTATSVVGAYFGAAGAGAEPSEGMQGQQTNVGQTSSIPGGGTRTMTSADYSNPYMDQETYNVKRGGYQSYGSSGGDTGYTTQKGYLQSPESYKTKRQAGYLN